MPAGYDAEVASLFRDLRVASNLTEVDLAARIAAPVEVVHALEQGAIYALPPWPETCRVVNAYGTLLNLDTRPLLRRIYAQLEAGVVELGPKPVDVPVMVPPAPGAAGTAPAPPLPQTTPAWPNGQGATVQPPPTGPDGLRPRGPEPGAQAPAWPSAAQPAVPGVAPPPSSWPDGSQPAQPHPAPPQAVQPQAAPPQAAPPQSPQAPGLQSPVHAPDGGVQPVEDASFPETGYDQAGGYAPEAAVQPQEDAAFPGEAEPAAAPEPKKKSAFVKWGIGAVVAAIVVAGLLIAFGDSSSDTGLMSGFNTSDPVLDADDPRSRKADRLPSKF